MAGNTYKERILALSKLEVTQLQSLLVAALKATQYSAFENGGAKFSLLEGVINKDEKGQYIFTPSNALRGLLSKWDYPILLQQEESRFIQLLTLALQEIQ